MAIRFPVVAVLLGAACVGGCATYVDNFKERVLSHNAQVHDAMNGEALLNLVRASRLESLNFLALNQTSGGRTQSLNLGLPSLTIGPAKSTTQKQFTFSGNSETNSMTGGFQTNPLVSETFQQGMMSPITPRELAMLIAAHGREAVLLAVIDQVRINDSIWFADRGKTKDDILKDKTISHHIESHIFQNDPTDNQMDGSDVDCTSANYLPDPNTDIGQNALKGDAKYVDYVLQKITAQKSNNYWVIGDMRQCHFAKFRALLTALLRVGLTVDVYEKPTAVADAGSDPPAPTPRNAKKQANDVPGNDNAYESTTEARFCLNAAKVESPIDWIQGVTVLGGLLRCEYIPKNLSELKIPFDRGWSDVERKERWGYLDEVTIRLRSPIAVYRYLGELVRTHNGGKGPTGLFTYSTQDAKQQYGLDEKSPYITVTEDNNDCAVSVDHADRTFCVKRDDLSTLNLLSMLQNLRNLNTKSSDLNAPFTVHTTSW
jgi:hypothetical protein